MTELEFRLQSGLPLWSPKTKNKRTTMKNTIKTILCLQITAMFLTAALAGPVAPGEKVPFKGSLQGAATITPLAPPLISVVIEGTGKATQLGRFTVDLLEVVNVTASTGVG